MSPAILRVCTKREQPPLAAGEAQTGLRYTAHPFPGRYLYYHEPAQVLAPFAPGPAARRLWPERSPAAAAGARRDGACPMSSFQYRQHQLYAEDVPLAAIAAEYGTPCFVYSRSQLEQQFRAYQNALGEHPHLICYAVKANSNLAVLNVLARLGAGFDIVSGGELARVLAAGGRADRVIFSGVGKTVEEMQQALEAGILCFNVESLPELERLSAVANAMELTARISLRVNPDVDAGTHPYISTGLKENKFGVDIQEALAIYQRARELPGIEIVGVDCHIGSQLTS